MALRREWRLFTDEVQRVPDLILAIEP